MAVTKLDIQEALDQYMKELAAEEGNYRNFDEYWEAWRKEKDIKSWDITDFIGSFVTHLQDGNIKVA